jgi:spore maturation protein B
MIMNIINELSRWAVPTLLFVIPLTAYLRKVKVYETFVEGAQDGFNTAIKTIPFLVAMMVAIGVFRASGAMDLMVQGLSPILELVGFPPEALPLAIMRPLSGGGALGISSELIKVYGPDSFIGRLASTMQGSTDTTFFVLTLYFGSVGIKKYRYSPISGLAADLTGLIASVYIVSLVFGG